MEQSAEAEQPILPNLADLQLSQIGDLPQAGLRASVRLLLRRLEDEHEPLYSFNASI